MARAQGFNFEIEGLERFEKGLKLGDRMLQDVWRDILRGPFGDEFLEDLKARVSDNKDTGQLLRYLKVNDYGRDGVEIGAGRGAFGTDHPPRNGKRSRASMGSVATWLESGTRMHMIPKKVTPYNHLFFGGRHVSRVTHPGTRARRPTYHTLRVFKGEAERLLVRELDRRLAHKMGLRHG